MRFYLMKASRTLLLFIFVARCWASVVREGRELVSAACSNDLFCFGLSIRKSPANASEGLRWYFSAYFSSCFCPQRPQKPLCLPRPAPQPAQVSPSFAPQLVQ